MSLGFPVKVDWDGPDDLPEVVILPAEVCRRYYYKESQNDIWQLLDWLEGKYGWCVNGVEFL